MNLTLSLGLKPSDKNYFLKFNFYTNRLCLVSMGTLKKLKKSVEVFS